MYHVTSAGKPSPRDDVHAGTATDTLASVALGVSEHFAEDGRAAVDTAHRAARETHAAEIGTGHLLVGALRHADTNLQDLLNRYGVTAEAARGQLIPGRADDPVVASPQFSAQLRTALAVANTAARRHGARIGCAHLVLALMLVRDRSLIAFLRSRAEVDELATGLYAQIA